MPGIIPEAQLRKMHLNLPTGYVVRPIAPYCLPGSFSFVLDGAQRKGLLTCIEERIHHVVYLVFKPENVAGALTAVVF